MSVSGGGKGYMCIHFHQSTMKGSGPPAVIICFLEARSLTFQFSAIANRSTLLIEPMNFLRQNLFHSKGIVPG